MTTETTLRRTKIVATLGPATDVPGMLEKILAEGVNVVRLNLSHGQPDDHRARTNAVRVAAEKLKLELSGIKTGKEVEALVKRLYNTPKDIVAKVAAITKG